MLMTFVADHLASNTFSTLAAFQAQDSINSGNSKLLMIFIGLAAIALLTQAGVVVFMALGARKAQQELTSHFIELKEKAMPLIATSHNLVTELTPEIREITTRISKIAAQVERLSVLVNEKAEEFAPTISAANRTAAEANETAQDLNRKARAQVTRVNGMVTTALDATARLGVAIEKGITVPGREVAGILSGLKVGFDTLLSGARAFGSGGRLGGRSTPRPTPPRPMTPYRIIEEPVAPYPGRRPNSDLDL